MNKRLLFVVLLLGFAAMSMAQTTLDPAQFVNDQITAGGVYIVEAGQAYAFDGRLDITWDVTIQGPDVDWIMNAENPPLLVNTPADDGTGREFIEIGTGGSLTLQNLVMSGLHSNDAVVGTFIRSVAGTGFTVNNVAFVDWQDFAILNDSKFCDISVTNCVFINGVRLSYSPWGGFPMRLNVAGDNVLLENNTVVNSGRLFTNSGPFFNATIHEIHNTYVNFSKAGHEQRAYEMIQANNIFYNYDFAGRSSVNNTYDSYFTTWNYFSDAKTKLDSTSLYLGQNLFFRHPDILDWYETMGGDTILTGLLWEHADVDSFVTMDNDYKIGTNYSEFDLDFTVAPDNHEALLQWLDEYWFEGHRGADWTDWRIDSGISWDAGTGLPVMNWPPEIDLSYGNTYMQTAGTDGLPLGDLNWWPTQKATYLANKDQYIAALRDSIANATGLYVPGAPTPMITPATTAVGEDAALSPNMFQLEQNYPNPFNPSTAVKFSIGKAGSIDLKVYNVAGQLVKTVVCDQMYTAGSYMVTIDMEEFGNGVYFTVLSNGTQKSIRKMTLLK